jgi:hypothetical protein
LAARLDESMRIAVRAKEQSARDLRREHREHRISAFSTKFSGKAMYGQVLCGIERNRHSAGSWLDRAVLSNAEIAHRAFDPNAELPAGAPDLGQPICFRLHGSKHGLSGVANGSILHGMLNQFYRGAEAERLES